MPEFVIVGGGVYGAATAWALAQRGAEVVLLEKSHIASGASGGLGMRGVRANGRDTRELPLMREAYERWPTLADDLKGETGYERTGQLLFIEREQDVPAAEARAWAQTQLGIPTRVLNRQEIHDLAPRTSDRVIMALHCPNDGIADHTATTQAYVAAAAALGVTIREDAEVVDLVRRGRRVTAVEVGTGETFAVDKGLILLANAGTRMLLENAFGVRLPIWSVLPQVLRSNAAPTERPVPCLIGHAHRTLAIKPLPDRSVMVSGGWRGRWSAVSGRGETVAEQVTGNWNEAVAVFPPLAAMRVSEADASRIETYCLDDIPIIDRLPEANNVLVGCGWCGHGWAIAPAVAPLLAVWALDGHRPASLEPFALRRFNL